MLVAEREGGLVRWGETYSVDSGSLAVLGETVARRIVETMGGEPAAPRTIAALPEVYELYWRARYLWSLREHESVLRAIELLRQLIELDPGFAPAHAALADIYAHNATGDRPRYLVEFGRERPRALEMPGSGAHRTRFENLLGKGGNVALAPTSRGGRRRL